MKVKAYVKKGCVDKSRTPHEAGATPDLDKVTDKKLWDLNLVEDYDEKKHGLSKDSELQIANAEIVKLRGEIESLNDADADAEKTALETKVTELTDANNALETKVTELIEDADEALRARITELEGYVEKAIGLQKGKIPNGYKKA